MSKAISALLLKSKIDSIKSTSLQRTYLLDCLDRQGFIKRVTEDYVSPDQDEDDSNICKICNTSSIFYSNHEATCNNCGIVQNDQVINPFKTYKQDLNIGRGTFIEEGTTMVKIMKDGKEVIRDLARVNTWVNTDPEEDKIKKAISFVTDVTEKIAIDYPPLIFDRIIKEIIEMWYLIITTVPTLRGYEKRSLAIWSIYYPMVYNELKISIQKLGRMFDIQIGDVMKHNYMMKNIFKNTKYKNYISIKVGGSVELELDNFLINKLERVKKNIKTHEDAPLGDKQIYGIIYGIAKKESSKNMKYKKYTLPFMSEKTGVAQSIISTEASKYSRFIT